MIKSFRMGGVHPPEDKLSAEAKIEVMAAPNIAVIPLIQHIGTPAHAIVSKGDRVRVGQLIAKAEGYVSSNIHASVSGMVTAVESRPDVGGRPIPSIVIEREGDEWVDGLMSDMGGDVENFNVEDYSIQDIVSRVESCGVVGLGGATFPTHLKLSIPAKKKVDSLIINGSECEPYLTSDYRVMMEYSERAIAGAKLAAKALGVERIYIGIEENKKLAIEKLAKLADKETNIEIEVVPLKIKYPQGGEKQLIEAVLRRRIPSQGLPSDVCVSVQNISTTLLVYDAVVYNRPVIERVVTVTGKELENPSNLLVRIGTPIKELIDHCGGLPEKSGKIVIGGPMMGKATTNMELPITKGVSGVVVFKESESLREKEGVCIKCRRCIEACPMGLQPYLLYKLGKRYRFEDMEREYAHDCIECGSCSYICPSYLPLLDYIRLGKQEALKIRRARR